MLTISLWARLRAGLQEEFFNFGEVMPCTGECLGTNTKRPQFKALKQEVHCSREAPPVGGLEFL